MKYRYIAVEGNIGAGKTTLVHKLSRDISASIILEQFAGNIFLEKFYADPEKYAFQLETGLLTDRFNQLKTDQKPDQATLISDYYFGKGLVFAKINLPPEQFELFLNLYENFSAQLLQPDIILYLHNTIPNLQKNIRERGRTYEQKISDTYLQKITAGYESLFQTTRQIPVLSIDLEDKNFVSNNSFYHGIRNLLESSWEPGINQISYKLF
jgi:deoxyguanosine kinase